MAAPPPEAVSRVPGEPCSVSTCTWYLVRASFTQRLQKTVEDDVRNLGPGPVLGAELIHLSALFTVLH